MENLSRQSPINKTISIYTKKSCLPKMNGGQDFLMKIFGRKSGID